jgi:tight adherence protein B
MNLTISILYSVSVLAILLATYFFLDYRNYKREWLHKVKEWYPEEERKSFISKLGDRYDKRESAKALKLKLQNANVKLLPSEYIGVLVVGALTIFVMFFVIFKMPMRFSLLLAFGLMAITHFLLFYLRKNNYEIRFNEQLSEVCRLLGNAARSGLTINQGLEIVAREIPSPAGDEFRRLTNELKLGVPLESAFRSIQRRNRSRDFNLFIATLLIQKKTGGNLAVTLETMANTFEDRKILAQTIKTMTAEQKYISFIIPVMPVFLLLIMNNVIDGFIEPLFSGIGVVLLILFIATIVMSFIIIRKITDIKV